ncbi:uncharacterized protein LOC113282123 [Papaver somniferum]|uniref:uncharacterized protein LOC113282123 n=1 Tax=Papaver somniferum TaxID=3469 RepID=UPI000E6F6BDC|nr:uncharacterized protein LOC113282123 [Papaver somniferum]
MESEDLHESEIPASSNLSPREQILKDAVMKLFMARHSSEPPLLKAQKIKLIEDNISSFFPALRTRPTHPPYATMVMEAIKEMNEEGGSNVDDISKYIEMNFQGLPFAHSHFLKHYLKKLVDSGEILYSCYNACYALPPHLNCKPTSPEREKEHEQQHQQQPEQEEKRSRGRLRKKYVAGEEGDSLVGSGDLGNLSQENSVVRTDSLQLCRDNNEDLMELGGEGEKHQQGDYSNIVFALEANPLQHQRALIDCANIVVGLEASPAQQQQLMDGGRPSRIYVNQQEIVEQHHQSACVKQILEAGKRRGRGRPRRIHAHQETVEQQHQKGVVEEPLQQQQEIVEEHSQQRQYKGRGRPRKIHAHQQENVEQHHQSADSKPVVEIEPEFSQEPCPGRLLGMQEEQETEEQRNPTSAYYTVVENEEGSSQKQHSKRRGRGRPRKEPVKQETMKHHTPIVENNTVVGIEVGPLDQLSEPRGVPSKKCEAKQSEMSKSISISCDDEDGLVHAHQQEIVEQHHQNADSKPVVEIEGGSSEQPKSKRRGRGRPRKEPIKQATVMQHTPIVENITVVGIEVGPLHQSSEPQEVPSKKCEAEQSEMSESIPIFYGDEDGLIVLGEGDTLTSAIDAIDAPAMENQPQRMAVAEEGDAEQTHQLAITEQQHRNIEAILAVGTEVGYVQAEKSEKCETEHAEMIQTFYGDGSENEAQTMENQPPEMALAKEEDIEQIHQVGLIRQQHRDIDANLAIETEVAHMLGLIVLGTGNSPTSVIEALPTEYQPPWMIISDTGNTEQIHQQGIIEQHHRNIDVNLAVGTEVAHLQAEINEKFETKQAEMSESTQTFFGDEDGLIFVGSGNSFASVIEVVPLECQPPWMALSEEDDTERIHQQGMIEQQNRNTDVNLAVGTEIEHMLTEVKDKCETEQAHMSESIQFFYGDEDGLIVLGNDNSLTSAMEAPRMENQPPWMDVTEEGDTEQLHQQGMLEQQHPNIDFNLDVVIEVGHVQTEQQLNHRGSMTRTHKQSKTELEEKSESIRLCADDSTEGGLAGEVSPDKRPKEVAFPDKRRKEVVTLLQQQSKRQLRPRPHEPYKGRLRRLKHTTYHL